MAAAMLLPSTGADPEGKGNRRSLAMGVCLGFWVLGVGPWLDPALCVY